MKPILLALALMSVAPLAQAQPYPGPPPGYAPPPPPGPPGPPPGDPYWRHDGDWRRREEIRAEEYRREEWRRTHCVVDYNGQEFCRR